MNSILAEMINDNDIEKDKWKTSYNHKTEKTFDGNIVMFRKNEQQYKKRFPVKSCCDGILPTWEDAMERPEQITVTADSAFVDTLTGWNFDGDNVLICCECGCIHEGDFRERQIDKKETKETEAEPTEAEMLEAIKDMDITAI